MPNEARGEGRPSGMGSSMSTYLLGHVYALWLYERLDDCTSRHEVRSIVE